MKSRVAREPTPARRSIGWEVGMRKSDIPPFRFRGPKAAVCSQGSKAFSRDHWKPPPVKTPRR